MDGESVPMRIPQNDPMAMELRLAVRGGDLATVGRLLAEHPGLARARFVGRNEGTRTLLHFVADWPGYFPNGAEMVRLMVSAGADPSAPATGGDAETPLHWAASSDDVDVAAALIDAGADIESTGGTIGAGPPLANAVGYGCWHVARLLVARGARVGSLWEAAALGDRPRVEELLAADPPPAAAGINEAFWQACHGGQRRMAEFLLARGADINTAPDYASGSTPLQAAAEVDTRHQALISWLRARGAAGD
ncbi:MAG TPA: ankyrin repeat domain-containing protein [Streptosporangiaceae bacterium]